MWQRWAVLATVLAAVFSSLFSQSLQVRVVDLQGRPVAGVRLQLVQDRSLVSSGFSNRSGECRFSNLAAGTYSLWIPQMGFRQPTRKITVIEGQEVHYDVTLPALEEEVVVTATRTEAPATHLGSSVTVISEEEIQLQGARTVAELLATVPGLAVARNGGIGSVTSLFVRGGESDYVKVLIDGIPLNEPGGAVDLSNLSTTHIERVEVVRGPQSALYGSDAMAGVVQIFTRRGRIETARPRAEVSLEGGTFDSFQGTARLEGALGRLSYSAAFRHLDTENADPNDFFHNNSFSTRLDLETGNRSAVTLTARLERGRSGVPGPTAFGRPDLEEFSRKRDFLVGLQWTQQLSNSWTQKLSYFQSYRNQLSEDPLDSGSYVPEFRGRQAPFPSFDFPFSFLNATRRHVVNYQSDFFLATHLLSAGLEYEEQRGKVGSVEASRTNFGYYLQDQFVLFQRLAVVAGLRLEDNGSFGFFASPRVSAAFLWRDGGKDRFWGMTRPKFSFGLGIKEPTFLESFSPNFFFRGNPELEPERSRSVEGGIEQLLAGEKIQLEATLFYNRYQDQIAFQVVDFETFEGSFFNIGESRAWGSEHTLTLRPSEELTLSGSYTYLDSNVVRSTNPFNPVFQEGAALLRRPRHSGFLQVGWNSSSWKVRSDVVFVGKRADSDFAGLGLTSVDGYTRWDLASSYRLMPNLELYAVLNNLLNQEYFEVLGFPALKFHFRAGLRVGW